jgi:hypothetical protein
MLIVLPFVTIFISPVPTRLEVAGAEICSELAE